MLKFFFLFLFSFCAVQAEWAERDACDTAVINNMLRANRGAAGFSALCAQSAMALVNNQLDIGRAAQDLVNKNTVKALVKAMAAAGLVAGIGQALNIPTAPGQVKGLTGHLQNQLVRQGVAAALDMASGNRPDAALQQAAVGVAAGVAGGLGANQIGQAYTQQMIGAVTHKLLHMGMAAGIGAASGALLGDDPGSKALAAGLGAGAAETLHDIIVEDSNAVTDRITRRAAAEGIDLQDERAQSTLINEEIRARLEFSKFGGAVAGFFAHQDVGAASAAATNAIDNNAYNIAFSAIASALEGLIALGRGAAVLRKGADAVGKAVKVAKAIEHATSQAGQGGGGEPGQDPEEPKDQKQNSSQEDKQFSREKKALVDMAKADKKRGITKEDMQAYKDLNKELPDPFPDGMVRGEETHPFRGPHAQQPHGHVGPVDHIPVRK